MKKTKDVIIFGTRPEVIKFFPLIQKKKFILINTGQQKELSKMMLDLFNIKPDIDLKLMKKDQTLCNFLSIAIKELDKVIKCKKINRIWVQGDTSSALAGALVAKMNKIELIHLEAGLRTYDINNPFPEETNRTLIDHMSNILLAPTNKAVKNLIQENVTGKIYLVGNTIVDALEYFKDKLPKERPFKEKYVLATVHRRESFGKNIIEIFSAFKKLSKRIKVILPAHPNPNVQKALKRVNLKTIKPVDYLTFLWYLRDCEYAITDSGGVQEEAPSFNKKVIVLRKVTERQELIENGYGVLIDNFISEDIFKNILSFSIKKIFLFKNPFGDGNSATKILKIIK